jgi:DsbC/DsbD-like thiol-disulfide interchange protein
MRWLFLLAMVVSGTAAAQYFQPVDPRLVVSTAHVEAGKPFQVGVLFHIQRGWHVYWHNPGDAGLPTSIRWTLPGGFTAGPLRWPVPQRFEQPGGVVGYGYEDAVLLSATVTPPSTLEERAAIPVRADTGWLACEKLCLRGKKSLDVTLGPDGGPSDPALFTEWAAKLPAEVGAGSSPVTLASGGGVPRDGQLGTVTVTLDWKEAPKTVDWFPPSDPALNVEEARSETDGSRTRLTFRAKRLAGEEPESTTLDSVVAYTDAAGVRRGVRIPIVLDGKET